LRNPLQSTPGAQKHKALGSPCDWEREESAEAKRATDLDRWRDELLARRLRARQATSVIPGRFFVSSGASDLAPNVPAAWGTCPPRPATGAYRIGSRASPANPVSLADD
jgi:hypothetical protein